MSNELPSWAELAKPGLAVLCLGVFWAWETFLPLLAARQRRWRHAGRNLLIALLNTIVLGLLFGAATVGIAVWATEHQLGLLHQLGLAWWWRLPLAVLLLDGWLYLWHRLNHRLPLLWRFHRMHHSDREMDVTTATRFHLGEHLGAATLRLGLIPLWGVTVPEIVLYEALVVAVTMFHHANISLGRWEWLLRWLIVTPGMHQIHHSRLAAETDSNYAVLFSFWDRLAGSYRTRTSSEPVELGLSDFDDDSWQSVAGMLRTPFVTPVSRAEAKPPPASASVHASGESQLQAQSRSELDAAKPAGQPLPAGRH